MAITVTEITDPGCPWAYSAAPALATLRWRYGDQLDWKLVMIGLTEEASELDKRGYGPLQAAEGIVTHFQDYGMPFDTALRERSIATGRACRAVVAARLLDPELGTQAFRALQFARFVTMLPFDTDDGIRAALRSVDGLDGDALIAAIATADVEDAYQSDRAIARSAAGSPTECQGKHAASDGVVRYTAPSLLFATDAGEKLEAGGFQPIEAYDVVIANLDPTLERHPAPETPDPVLAEAPYPLTTAEVAAALGLDRKAAEVALLRACDRGAVLREGVAGGALWRAA